MSHTKNDDIKIILRIKEGYIEEFEHIVHRYNTIIFLFIKRKLFDKDDVDDVVQETFLKFYKSIARFDEKRPVLPYLYEIAKNELKMYYRRYKKTIGLENVEGSVMDYSNAPIFIETQNLFSNISPLQKDILTLRADGYTYEEVGEKLHKNTNTIKTLARRARLKIQHAHHEKNT